MSQAAAWNGGQTLMDVWHVILNPRHHLFPSHTRPGRLGPYDIIPWTPTCSKNINRSSQWPLHLEGPQERESTRIVYTTTSGVIHLTAQWHTHIPFKKTKKNTVGLLNPPCSGSGSLKLILVLGKVSTGKWTLSVKALLCAGTGVHFLRAGEPESLGLQKPHAKLPFFFFFYLNRECYRSDCETCQQRIMGG